MESAEEVAADARRALEHIDAENLDPDDGLRLRPAGLQSPDRVLQVSLAQGANIVRRELGAPETAIRAADPALQIDGEAPPLPAGVQQ